MAMFTLKVLMFNSVLSLKYYLLFVLCDCSKYFLNATAFRLQWEQFMVLKQRACVDMTLNAARCVYGRKYG